MPDRWYAGNAEDERHDYRGWMIGHFIDSAESPRATSDVEVKWGNHAAGETRAEWTTAEQRTTLLMLIAGKFRLDLPTKASISPGKVTTWSGVQDWTTHGKQKLTPW